MCKNKFHSFQENIYSILHFPCEVFVNLNTQREISSSLENREYGRGDPLR
jgi:hypothetical protein